MLNKPESGVSAAFAERKVQAAKRDKNGRKQQRIEANKRRWAGVLGKFKNISRIWRGGQEATGWWRVFFCGF
jgi:hypothetical protein